MALCINGTEYLSVPEAARHLGVPRRRLYRWAVGKAALPLGISIESFRDSCSRRVYLPRSSVVELGRALRNETLEEIRGRLMELEARIARGVDGATIHTLREATVTLIRDALFEFYRKGVDHGRAQASRKRREAPAALAVCAPVAFPWLP